MRTRYKKKCLIVLPISLILILPLPLVCMFPQWGSLYFLLSIIPGFILYIWGISLLASAKGQSLAIILTIFFGVLFPLVILLVIEDKHRKY